MRTLSKVVTLQKLTDLCILSKNFRGRYPKSCATNFLLLNF